jgi:hypothetical protein
MLQKGQSCEASKKSKSLHSPSMSRHLTELPSNGENIYYSDIFRMVFAWDSCLLPDKGTIHDSYHRNQTIYKQDIEDFA